MSGIGRGNDRGRSVDSDSVPSSDPDVRSSSGRGAPLGQRVSQNTSAPPPQAPITSIGRRKGSDSKGALGSQRRSTAVDRAQSPAEQESTTEPRDIRSIAQSIVDEEALGVTSAKGQFIKATDTVTWLNGAASTTHSVT